MSWQWGLDCVSIRAVDEMSRSGFTYVMLLTIGMEHGGIQGHLLDLLSWDQIRSSITALLRQWS
jgi:hypothetical protein